MFIIVTVRDKDKDGNIVGISKYTTTEYIKHIKIKRSEMLDNLFIQARNELQNSLFTQGNDLQKELGG